MFNVSRTPTARFALLCGTFILAGCSSSSDGGSGGSAGSSSAGSSSAGSSSADAGTSGDAGSPAAAGNSGDAGSPAGAAGDPGSAGGGTAGSGTAGSAASGDTYFSLKAAGTFQDFPIIKQAAYLGNVQITAATPNAELNGAQITLHVPAKVGTYACPATEQNPPTTYISYLTTTGGKISAVSAGAKGEGACSVTLTEVGTKVGEFAVGTFTASLVGATPVMITEGKFKVTLGVMKP